MWLIVLYILAAHADPTPTGGAACSYDTSCGYGYCATYMFNNTITSECACGELYADPTCSYIRNVQTSTVCIHLVLFPFFIYGVGNFMLGYWEKAVIQLIMGLCFYIIIMPAVLIARARAEILGPDSRADTKKWLLKWLAAPCIVILAGFIWSLYDGVMISLGEISDSNGYTLASY